MALFGFISCLVIVLAFIDVSEQIAGGQEVDTISQFPYVVQVSMLDGRFICSGAIISENYILTAAYCIYNALSEDISVRAGNVVRGEGVHIPIAEAVTHPDYDRPENNLDIAYMRTVSPIEFNEDIQPGVLRVDGHTPLHSHTQSDTVTVTGWGKQGRPGERSLNVLRKTDLDFVNYARCQPAYPFISITKNMFCAENTSEMNAGACDGDNGAPATYGSVLMGISSFTNGCGAGMAPSVFTNLHAREVRDFITQSTGIHYSPPSHH